MQAIGFIGASNESTYRVQKDGVDFDLTQAGVTRIDVVDEGQVLSSDDDAVSFSGSTLTIKWGAFSLPPDTYSPTIYAYKASDPDGEVLFGPLKSPITLQLVENERPTA